MRTTENVVGKRPHSLQAWATGIGLAVVLYGLVSGGPGLADDTTSDPVRDLKSARSYRAGFANRTSDYESLLPAWRQGAYDVRIRFRNVLDRLIKLYAAAPADRERADEIALRIAETVNELLQGQTIEGNESLLNALRGRFPRAEKPGEEKAKLSPPNGNSRKELEEHDRAIESFGIGMRAALSVLSLRNGDQLLRAAGKADEYEGFPQFTKLKEPFEPASLNQSRDKSYPVQVELSLLSRIADRMAQAGVEKARKLFILSALKDEPTEADEDGKLQPKARNEALLELKRTVHQSYILAATLGALQTDAQFQDNGGRAQLVHTAMAREFFQRIRKGMVPFGNSKTFVPSGSLESYVGRANNAVRKAKEAEDKARAEDFRFQAGREAAAKDKENERNQFLSPLSLLTGLNPRDNSALDLDHDGRTGEIEPEGDDRDKDGRNPEHESFDSLETLKGRQLYRATVVGRIDALLRTEYIQGKTTSQVGMLGDRILALKDAQFAGAQAYNTLNNIPKRIAITQDTTGKINMIVSDTGLIIGALEVSEVAANAVRVNSGTKGIPQAPFFEVSVNPGAAAQGAIRVMQTAARTTHEIRINNAKAESEVRSLLLEEDNAVIDVQRAKLRFDREMTNLELDYQKMDQLINDFAESHAAFGELWYHDPTNRVLLSAKLRQANLTLEESVVSLYQLARALEYEWNEEYRNPAIIPPDVQGVAATLGQGLYDKFTQTEDVFNIQNVTEADNFLGALQEWDQKMREIGSNVIAVRGPIRTQRLTNRTISFRDDVLALDNRLHAPALSDEERVAVFRRHINEHLVHGDSPMPGVCLTFGLALEGPGDVQPLLPFKNHWNLRVVGVTIETVADSGYSRRAAPDCVYYLTQAGTVSNQNYFDSAEKQKERIINRYSVPVAPDRPERSVFRSVLPSRVNNHADPAVPSYHREIEGERPIAASHWQLLLDPSYPRNFGFDVTRLRDIRITFEYVDGNPREFKWGGQ